jgi:hypothetical protein
MHPLINRAADIATRAASWLIAPPVAGLTADSLGRPPTWSEKGREWLARYLPLEIIATLTALIGGLLATVFTANAVAIAYAAAWSENIGYYALAFAREMRAVSSTDAAGPSRPLRAIKNLVLEFGPAELVDSFISRPACMYAATWLLGSVGLGIIVGKFVGDLIFYGLAIIAYEFRKSRQ